MCNAENDQKPCAAQQQFGWTKLPIDPAVISALQGRWRATRFGLLTVHGVTVRFDRAPTGSAPRKMVGLGNGCIALGSFRVDVGGFPDCLTWNCVDTQAPTQVVQWTRVETTNTMTAAEPQSTQVETRKLWPLDTVVEDNVCNVGWREVSSVTPVSLNGEPVTVRTRIRKRRFAVGTPAQVLSETLTNCLVKDDCASGSDQGALEPQANLVDTPSPSELLPHAPWLTPEHVALAASRSTAALVSWTAKVTHKADRNFAEAFALAVAGASATFVAGVSDSGNKSTASSAPLCTRRLKSPRERHAACADAPTTKRVRRDCAVKVDGT